MTNDNTLNAALDIIGYDCGWGCADYGCEDGPAHTPIDQILATLRRHGRSGHWHGALGIKSLGAHSELRDKYATLPLLREAHRRLYDAAYASASRQRLPLVIGGDHSSAIATWSAITTARQAHRRFGLIWIDAHMDCHTDATSHEGKWGGWWHGQPVSALLGHGLADFTTLGGAGAKLSPEHISIIGPHSFEPAEQKFTEKNNVRVYTLDEVKSRGFAAVFAEALTRATTGTRGWGLSIDLDAFHPEDSPGVGTHEADGLRAEDVCTTLSGVAHKAGFSGLELAEFNPHRDHNNKTGNLIEKLVNHIFTP